MLLPYEMAGFGAGGANYGGRLYVPTGAAVAWWDDPSFLAIDNAMQLNGGSSGPVSTPFSLSGSLYPARPVRIEVMTAGGLGVGKIRYSLDDGVSWSASIFTSSTMLLASDLILTVTTSSLTLGQVYVTAASVAYDQSGSAHHFVSVTAESYSAVNGPGALYRGALSNPQSSQHRFQNNTFRTGGGFSTNPNQAYSIVACVNVASGSTIRQIIGAGIGPTNFIFEFAINNANSQLRLSKRGSSDGAAIVATSPNNYITYGSWMPVGVLVAGSTVQFVKGTSKTTSSSIAFSGTGTVDNSTYFQSEGLGANQVSGSNSTVGVQVASMLVVPRLITTAEFDEHIASMVERWPGSLAA